ncbi:LysR family transcriptional regulator [Lentisphaera marina]|uniref:LysR family transcriptional regulator n=1 Tax=Lentisphaera marina TaxID=1111041 RepID=UPI0023665530|nr:LysR family transcriptional regulator [Lentisphaera marina]MDD7983503.1 LysR family transcriptional regulator [Lentisphaera marina]
MTLEQIHILKTVVEEGSFRAAADKLWKTQPAVSIAVSKLEKELGIQLFDRGHRSTKLSAQGQRIYEYAEQMLYNVQEITDLSQYLNNQHEEEISIAIDTICPLSTLLALLKNFFISYPKTRLKLNFEVLGGTMERLEQDEAHIVISNLESPSFSLDRILLWDIEMIPVCAPQTLILNKDKYISKMELRKSPQIIIPETSKERSHSKTLLQGGQRHYVSDLEIKKEMLLAGLGWGSMPKHKITKELSAGLLISFESDQIHSISKPFYACRSQDKLHGPVSSALWEQLHYLNN